MLMDVKQSRTRQGVRVVTSRIPHVQSVTLGIWVGVGSRYEPEALGGISHFTEHLLFKGTKRRSARDISVAIEGRGGYLNAFTSEEATCYYARVGYDQVDAALDVLADMFLNSAFDPKEIDKERGVIMEEIMMYRDRPQHAVQEMLTALVWPGHPLGRPIIGTPESVQAVKSRDFKNFVKERYVSSNTVLAFAGNLDHDTCVTRAEAFLKTVPMKSRAATCRRVGPKLPQQRTAFQAKDIEQTHLALALRVFGQNDERRFALRLLSAILGENMSSRLFQVVREKHGLAYSVHSSTQLFRDSGVLAISAGLDRKRKTQALDLIVKELVRIKERCVGNAELRRAKDYVIGQMRLSLESTTHQMMWIGDNLTTRRRFVSPEDTMRRLEAVTAEDIRRLAGQYLRGSRLSLAVISPDLSKADQQQMKEACGRL